MADVKRNYDASRRRADAAASRARVLDAARERLLRDGYAGTTIAQIAADADVAAKTVAKQFGNKPGLVKALFDAALVGNPDPGPLEERTDIVAIHDEPDPRRKLERFAAAMVVMLPRTAAIQLLIRESAPGSQLDEVWQTIKAGRLAGMTNLANNLATGGHLRDDITVDTARDVLWTYSSPDLYQLLVLERGWTHDDYQRFIANSTISALLRS